MEQTVSEALELPGHTLLIKTKTKDEWLQQARDAMDRAEAYGANTPNQMKDKEKNDLREALKALGQNPTF